MKKRSVYITALSIIYICVLYPLLSYVLYKYSDVFSYSYKNDYICLGAAIASLIFINLISQPLLSAVLCSAVCAGVSVLSYNYAFLFFPAILILCMSKSITSGNTGKNRVCYIVCVALAFFTVPVYIFGMTKADLAIWQFVEAEGVFYKILLGIYAIFYAVLLKLSFGLKPNKKQHLHSKTANYADMAFSSDKLSTVYLLAIIMLAGQTLYCAMYAEMHLSKTVAVFWGIETAMLFLTNDPACNKLRLKLLKSKPPAKPEA